MSAASPDREPPAGLGWRVGARLVDIVAFSWFVAFVLVEIDQRILGGDPWGRRPGRLEFDSARPVILVLVLAFLYEVVPTAVFGATPGKALFGLRVRLTSRVLPGPLVAFARGALLYLPLFFLGPYSGIVVVVLFVSVWIPANGRGLHDRLVGSLVVSIAERDDA